MIEYMLSKLDSLEAPSLQESQSIYMAQEVRKFMDEMPGGFFIYHADGNEEIIYANKALLRIFKCDTMEEFRILTGNSFKGLVHPEDLDQVEESIREQIEKSQYDLDYVEYRIIQKDGGIRWVEDYGHFIRSKTSGDIFYVFVGDSTEKRERLLAENLTLHQEHLRRLEIIEGLSINYDSIFYVDLDKDKVMPYRLSNRTGNIFTGLSQEQSFSWCMKTYADTCVYSEDRQMFLDTLSQTYIRERLAKSKTFYMNYRATDGSDMLYIQVRIVNTGDTGRVSPVLLGFQRVDKEIQYEMEKKKVMEEALTRATSANRAKSVFLSNMSHDMRTPLNAIFGFTALAKMCLEDSDEILNYLEQIEASGQQLLHLIDDVLELSWMETEEIRLLDEKCCLHELLKGLCNELMPQAEEKNLHFSLDFVNVKHNTVYSDGQRLKQVLKYIVGNAITYTEDGGRVSVDVTEKEALPNHYVVYEFKVSDTGIGISEEFQRHIFDPFEREKNTTLSGIHGTGLGLTIAKNIVDRMGGTIDLYSVLGQGSQFTVTLKFRTEYGPQPFSELGRVSGESLKNRRILVVEDNEINREIETELLESLGLIVDTAVDGSIAVEKVASADPEYYSLVLMDIQMPVMDGYQATRTIRKLGDPKLAGIPIVALSANALEKDIRMAQESGMNAHVAKPFDLENLSQVISKYILETH